MPELHIAINGNSYTVACKTGEELRLETLAQIVESRVQKLSASLGQIGENKLLLMAAILLADELTEGKPDASAFDSAPIRVLETAAQRIEDIAASLNHA